LFFLERFLAEHSDFGKHFLAWGEFKPSEKNPKNFLKRFDIQSV